MGLSASERGSISTPRPSRRTLVRRVPVALRERVLGPEVRVVAHHRTLQVDGEISLKTSRGMGDRRTEDVSGEVSGEVLTNGGNDSFVAEFGGVARRPNLRLSPSTSVTIGGAYRSGWEGVEGADWAWRTDVSGTNVTGRGRYVSAESLSSMSATDIDAGGRGGEGH